MPRNDPVDPEATSDPEEAERSIRLTDGEWCAAGERHGRLLKRLQDQGF